MEIIFGFFIALAVGLTGAGGGSFTTPVLVLATGLPAGVAVGTAMAFSAILRIVALPFYFVRGYVHRGYLRLLLLGAVPGLLAGIVLLQFMHDDKWNPTMLAAIGTTLILTSAFTLLPKNRPSVPGRTGARWIPLLALPIGLETGFSSAGAGALGSLLLLNFSDIQASQVVGTDLLFGMVLALVGSIFHLGVGSISSTSLLRLLVGGLPGVLIGSYLAPKLSVRRLRAVIAIIAIVLGLQLVSTGMLGFRKARAMPAVKVSSAGFSRSDFRDPTLRREAVTWRDAGLSPASR